MRLYTFLNVSTKNTNIRTLLFLVFFLDTLIDSHFQLFVLATEDYSGSTGLP